MVQVAGSRHSIELAKACGLKVENMISYEISADAHGIDVTAKYKLPVQKLEDVKKVVRGDFDE